MPHTHRPAHTGVIEDGTCALFPPLSFYQEAKERESISVPQDSKYYHHPGGEQQERTQPPGGESGQGPRPPVCRLSPDAFTRTRFQLLYPANQRVTSNWNPGVAICFMTPPVYRIPIIDVCRLSRMYKVLAVLRLRLLRAPRWVLSALVVAGTTHRTIRCARSTSGGRSRPGTAEPKPVAPQPASGSPVATWRCL